MAEFVAIGTVAALKTSSQLNIMERSENDIITQCKAGHMEAFVFLYDAYVEKIYKFLYFRTLHQELAEDITSQVFLQAMDKLNTFNETKGTFQAWLYQIARNLLIDEYRRRKPTDNIDAHFDLRDNTDLESQTNQVLTNEALLKILKTLPEESQELISMRLWDELSYAEIAAITGKTEGSLKMQFSRIVKRLQEYSHILVFILLLTRW